MAELPNLPDVKYIAVLQCEVVKQTCSGFFCEKAFTDRTGGFARYAKESPLRVIYLTCGGCCGKATHRKLANLIRCLDKQEQMPRSQIVVQLASCITKDNHHSPRCPNIDYIKALIARHGLTCVEDTRTSAKAQQRREAGLYPPMK